MSDLSEADDLKQIVERGYDRVAKEYSGLEEEEWPRMRWLKKALGEIQPGSSILDLGCGSGDPADIEIAKNHKVAGIDISETQISLARQNVSSGTFQ